MPAKALAVRRPSLYTWRMRTSTAVLAVLLGLPGLAAGEGLRFDRRPEAQAPSSAGAPVFTAADSTLYLYVATENPFFKEKKNLDALKKEVAAIYSGNKSPLFDALAKQVVLLSTSKEVDTAGSSLSFADGIVELTDESFGFGPSLGTTNNYFYAKVYVGKGTKIGGSGPGAFPGQTIYFPGAYNYSYGVAHEFLHQLVAKAGYLIKADPAHYCADYGHLNDGGLLTDAGDERLWRGASYQNVLDRPKTPATGIEKINDDHLLQIGRALYISRHASGLAHDRLKEIMARAGSRAYGF